MKKSQEIVNEKIQKVSEKDIIDFVQTRFDEVKKSKKIKELVEFQAMNKYMIMSRDQNELKILGNIVASYKKGTFEKIIDEYQNHLHLALKKSPTVKTHSNVIIHIFGYFSKEFNQLEKEQFFRLLEEYKEEKIAIGKILSEINPIIYRFNNTYLASQTYFLLYSDLQPGNLFAILAKK